MGYYIRVLTQSEKAVPFAELQDEFAKTITGADITIESGSPEAWEQIAIVHEDGREISVIERNTTEAGSLGSEEMLEFVEELHTAKPSVGADWAMDYLSRVKTIYAFEVFEEAYKDDGWEAIEAMQDILLMKLGGIVQADFEGFTNEDGFYVVWQFDDDVEGKSAMSVMRDGKWVNFVMDLEDQGQRAAFLAGEIPRGVEIIN